MEERIQYELQQMGRQDGGGGRNQGQQWRAAMVTGNTYNIGMTSLIGTLTLTKHFNKEPKQELFFSTLFLKNV